MNSVSPLSNSLIGLCVYKSDHDAMLVLLIAVGTNKQVHSYRKENNQVTWVEFRMSKSKQKSTKD